MNIRALRAAAAALALASIHMLGTGPASSTADIIGHTGSLQIRNAPDSVMRNVWESNLFTRVFQEQRGMVLEEGLIVDITATGRVHELSDYTPGTIEAGTAIDSWFVHQDKRAGAGRLTLTGTITFDQNILGVICNKATLTATDGMLGVNDTDYQPGVLVAKGMDLAPDRDRFVISANRRTIRYTIVTSGAMDEMRIITAAAPVPAPGCVAVMLAGLLCTSRSRRRA